MDNIAHRLHSSYSEIAFFWKNFLQKIEGLIYDLIHHPQFLHTWYFSTHTWKCIFKREKISSTFFQCLKIDKLWILHFATKIFLHFLNNFSKYKICSPIFSWKWKFFIDKDQELKINNKSNAFWHRCQLKKNQTSTNHTNLSINLRNMKEERISRPTLPVAKIN